MALSKVLATQAWAPELDPECQHKNSGVAVQTCNPRAGEAEVGRSLPPNPQTGWSIRCQVPMRDPVIIEKRWIVPRNRNDTQSWPLTSRCMHIQAYTYLHTHTHAHTPFTHELPHPKHKEMKSYKMEKRSIIIIEGKLLTAKGINRYVNEQGWKYNYIVKPTVKALNRRQATS